jgi:hypothetical protein
MGNYLDLEKHFVERTIKLIDQYHATLNNYPFEKQFNYTLTINCLLGLIVMPKERVGRYIPNPRLIQNLRSEIGLRQSVFGNNIASLQELVQKLRHSVAHFDIKIISDNEQQLIDWIEFSDSRENGQLVARFRAEELLPFLKYYANCLLENLSRHRA